MGTTKEAPMEQTPHGKRTAGEGWFVLNAKEAAWFASPKFGAAVTFEGAHRFAQVGVNLHLIEPGQPNGYYHRESEQEDFLVLAGECLLIIEGQERRLRPWDFVHCPPGTDHIFVGAKEGPCLILMLGARNPSSSIVYPAEPAALRHEAGVTRETTSPKEAYAGLQRPAPAPVPPAALELMKGAAPTA
jgi:uncharacterized cupin superfamily protein